MKTRLQKVIREFDCFVGKVAREAIEDSPYKTVSSVVDRAYKMGFTQVKRYSWFANMSCVCKVSQSEQKPDAGFKEPRRMLRIQEMLILFNIIEVDPDKYLTKIINEFNNKVAPCLNKTKKAKIK